MLRKGRTGVNDEHDALYEFKLKLGSNPEFTANVMVSYARAVYRLAAEGAVGCRTILDIPVAYAFPGEREALLLRFVSECCGWKRDRKLRLRMCII